MTRLLLLALSLTACANAAPPERYGFVTRLGNDTISVERIVRQGSSVVIDGTDRFPRVRIRHTAITLGDDGSIRHLDMTIRTPSEPANERDRHVTADVTRDSVHIVKRDGTGTLRRDFATSGGIAMAHVPQMYSLYELYFQAALHRARATHLASGDSVAMRQFYIDREFDRFPLHAGFVRPLPNRRAEIWHDWLSGIGEATFDSSDHMLTYSGERTTYKVDVHRVSDPPDIATLASRYTAAEAASGVRQLSVRDTARASIGATTFAIDYGRPLARGRTLVGDVIPYDDVWRTGANAATQFTTSSPVTIGDIHLAAGTYTLWTVPHRSGVDLIVNRQHGQWGTSYNRSYDIGKTPLTVGTTSAPVEQLTISIVPTGATGGTLALEWGTFRWTVPIELTASK